MLNYLFYESINKIFMRITAFKRHTYKNALKIKLNAPACASFQAEISEMVIYFKLNNFLRKKTEKITKIYISIYIYI